MALPKRSRQHAPTVGSLIVVAALLFSACSGSSANVSDGTRQAAEPATPTLAPTVAAAGESSTSASAVETPATETVPILVVSTTIPRGTSVRELLDAPGLYLTMVEVSLDQVDDGAIASIADLDEFANFVVAQELPQGQQLIAAALRDPSNFDTAADQAASTEAGYALEIAPSRAVGGFLRAGDTVVILATVDDGSGSLTTMVLTEATRVLKVETLLPDQALTTLDDLLDELKQRVTLSLNATRSAALDEHPSSMLRLAVVAAAESGYTLSVSVAASRIDGADPERGQQVDVVNAESQVVLASNSAVLQVAAALELTATEDSAADPEYTILLDLDLDELVAVVTALETAGIGLRIS